MNEKQTTGDDAMTINQKRKYNSIMADAHKMADHSGLISPSQIQLWFGGKLTSCGTLEYARNLRRGMAAVCLAAGNGFPGDMDAFTAAGLSGIS